MLAKKVYLKGKPFNSTLWALVAVGILLVIVTVVLIVLRWQWKNMKRVQLETDAHLAREIHLAVQEGVELPKSVLAAAGLDDNKNKCGKKDVSETEVGDRRLLPETRSKLDDSTTPVNQPTLIRAKVQGVSEIRDPKTMFMASDQPVTQESVLPRTGIEEEDIL